MKETLFRQLQEGGCAGCTCFLHSVYCLSRVSLRAGGRPRIWSQQHSSVTWGKLLITFCMLTKLQIHRDKGWGDIDYFSKQNTLLSHLSSLFPSFWCVSLYSHLCWLLPKKQNLLMQILWLLISFDSLVGGCHSFSWIPQPSAITADARFWH